MLVSGGVFIWDHGWFFCSINFYLQVILCPLGVRNMRSCAASQEKILGAKKGHGCEHWVFPKIGFFPPDHPFVHRVFHYFHHPFWGFSPLFLETPIGFFGGEFKERDQHATSIEKSVEKCIVSTSTISHIYGELNIVYI